MHDSIAVQVPKPQNNLLRYSPDDLLRKSAEFLQQGRQRPAGHVLEEDVEVIFFLDSTVVIDHVWVRLQPGKSMTTIERKNHIYKLLQTASSD